MNLYVLMGLIGRKEFGESLNAEHTTTYEDSTEACQDLPMEGDELRAAIDASFVGGACVAVVGAMRGADDGLVIVSLPGLTKREQAMAYTIGACYAAAGVEVAFIYLKPEEYDNRFYELLTHEQQAELDKMLCEIGDYREPTKAEYLNANEVTYEFWKEEEAVV